MKDILLYENNQIVAHEIKNSVSLPDNEQLGIFVFVFDKPIVEFLDSEKELLFKIIKSVNQDESKTVKIDLSSNSFSVEALEKRGAKSLIVFSDLVPAIFESLNLIQHQPCSIGGIEFFITKSIESFEKDAKCKNLLWSYMKSKL